LGLESQHVNALGLLIHSSANGTAVPGIKRIETAVVTWINRAAAVGGIHLLRRVATEAPVLSHNLPGRALHAVLLLAGFALGLVLDRKIGFLAFRLELCAFLSQLVLFKLEVGNAHARLELVGGKFRTLLVEFGFALIQAFLPGEKLVQKVPIYRLGRNYNPLPFGQVEAGLRVVHSK